jgi:hypothetical protein
LEKPPFINKRAENKQFLDKKAFRNLFIEQMSSFSLAERLGSEKKEHDNKKRNMFRNMF